jgi:hypothetical protein
MLTFGCTRPTHLQEKLRLQSLHPGAVGVHWQGAVPDVRHLPTNEASVRWKCLRKRPPSSHLMPPLQIELLLLGDILCKLLYMIA